MADDNKPNPYAAYGGDVAPVAPQLKPSADPYAAYGGSTADAAQEITIDPNKPRTATPNANLNTPQFQMPTNQEIVGKAIPDVAAPALAAAQKYAVQPFEEAAAAGVEYGGQAARLPLEVAAQRRMAQRGELKGEFRPVTMESRGVDQGLAAKEFPKTAGAVTAIGELVGGMATDPRMWALGLGSVGGATVQHLMSAGFSLQMIAGAAQNIPEIQEAIARGDSFNASRLITSSVISLGMGGLAGAHALDMPEVVVDRGPAENILSRKERVEATAKAKKGATDAGATHFFDPVSKSIVPLTKEAETGKSEVERGKRYEVRKEQFKKAVPPTTSAPYSDADYDVFRAHAEKYHAGTPIEEPIHVAHAAEAAGKQLDSKVSDLVKGKYGKEEISADLVQHVVDGLGELEQAKPGSIEKAREVLAQYNLDDKTLSSVDTLRKVLNDELRDKNLSTSDVSTKVKKLLSEAARDAIYDRLEQLDVKGAREMRGERAALSRVRDAAERQEFNGDKTVAKTGPSMTKQIAGQVVQHGLGMAGLATGGTIGSVAGPIGSTAGGLMGGAAGEAIGAKLKERIAPSAKTHSQLLQDSFSEKVAKAKPVQISDEGTPPTPEPPKTPGAESLPPPPAAPQPPAPAQRPDINHKLHGALASYFPNEQVGDTAHYKGLLQRFWDQWADMKNDVETQGGKYTPEDLEKANVVRRKINEATAAENEQMEKQNKANQDKYQKDVAKYQKDLEKHARDVEKLQLAAVAQAETERQAKADALLTDESIAHGVLKATEPAKPIDGTGDGRTSEQAHQHEGGHIMAAVAEGLEPMEFLSAEHPDVAENNGRAQINIDTSMAEEGNKGIIQKVVAALGGAAYDEVHNGIKLGRNTGARGDVKRAYELLREGGLKPGSALEKKVFNALYDRAKKHVSNPSALAIMKANLALREAGLDPRWHMSPERMTELNKKLQGIYGKTPSTEVPGERAAGGGDEGAVDAGGTGKESTGTGEGVRAKTAREDGEGAEGKRKPGGVEKFQKSSEPTTIKYLRNTQSSPNMGTRFGQHLEPAGRYMIENTAGIEPPSGWEGGTAEFKKPFVLDFGGGYQDPTNWKNVLSQTYGGKTGKALSDALRKDGYDAVITRQPHPDGGTETSEIVDLRKPTEKNALTASELHPEKDGVPSEEEAAERYRKYQEAQRVAEEKDAKEKAAFKKTMNLNLSVAEGADAYNKENEREPIEASVKPHNSAVAKQIADAYQEMKHEPKAPAVAKSYDALTKDVKKQWDYAQDKMGIKFEPWTKEGQPYANSKEMVADVRNNKHLYFFTGGDMPADHPMAKVEPSTGLTYNDMFRAVYDLFGHAAHGFEFGPKGEENAYAVHRQMFSPEAVPALTSETRGQNSWVNFGKHLRGESGEVAKKGEAGYVPPTQRPYAEQKAGLLPEEFHGAELAPKKDWAANVAGNLEKAPAGAVNPNNPEAPSKRYGLELMPEVRTEAHPTPEALRAYAQRPEIQEALATHPDIKLGWDTTGEKPEINIGVSTDDKQTALDVAKKLDQRALWDNEAQDTVPVGGEGKKTSFPDYPLEARLKDLKIEKLNLKKGTPKGSTAPLMENPLEVKGTGEGGKVSNLDIAKALNQYSKKQHPALTPDKAEPKEMVARAAKIAEDEAKYQLAQGRTGKEWYTTEMKEHDEVLGRMRPELLQGDKIDIDTPWPHTAKMSLFKAAEAITSAGQKPYGNLKAAMKAWDAYNETGEFPRDNGGKSWGPRGAEAYAQAFDMLNSLIKEKGEKGAAEWLLTEHPVSELRAEKEGAVTGKKDDMRPGALILGEKRGPFMQNLHGIESAFTADMWVSRSWNRWMGTMEFGKDPKTGQDLILSDSPRNNTERGLMRESFNKVADKLKMSVSSLQAVLWYYEQALYRAHGIPKESWSFSGAAQRVEKENAPTEEQESFPFGSAKAQGVAEGLGALPVQPSKFVNLKGK